MRLPAAALGVFALGGQRGVRAAPLLQSFGYGTTMRSRLAMSSVAAVRAAASSDR